jgi:hypothetical protein
MQGYAISYYDTEDASDDLEALFDALDEYSAPYFQFGAHPGDGSDYGFWLSEDWQDDFVPCAEPKDLERANPPNSICVNDLADVPAWFRGEVAVINDHGNVTLYTRNSRGKYTEIWSVV